MIYSPRDYLICMPSESKRSQFIFALHFTQNSALACPFSILAFQAYLAFSIGACLSRRLTNNRIQLNVCEMWMPDCTNS